ncbi:exonuclease domain-containing protein [Enterobacter hormaechei]|jgi:DNA polymerase III epsilon subunit-like protein|uniref:exonuclease domain-containing protein n=1 Tax=Enterobacter TaxID=547 RepID=UPI0007975721|nr:MULTISPECIES: exonuclease domain-containing protein [Enterobacter]HDS4389478.1 Lar family restriction alleviation protein [Enterobacter roggenkampii]HDZ1816703.1 Lar family restriction alleviation protein [Vibrio cholerae]HED3982036.1 Lar family restriction alleviation protein [Enterobacter hormaechei subsp. xiangfangensis]ELB7313028.1 Lar family restriction alleviation protein [Enterobacter hormaechei]ELC7456486.1 Lar family restriction alleviation protein [Enterobacter hormaechei]
MVNMQKNILAMIIHKWLKSDYVVIDTETTGLGEYAEIIEIAIINMRGEVLLDTLVKPTQPIPPEVTEINHITNEMVADAPAWCDVFPMVLAIITHHKWLAWNSGFDARMLEQTCFFTEVFPENHPYYAAAVTSRIHTSHIDAKAVYDQWYGEFDEKRKAFKRQSLTTAAARHGVSVEGAHRALADCKMVLAVLQKVGSPVTQTANVSETDLPPCPFCYGPPSLFTYYFDGVQRKPLYGPVHYGDDGLYAGSFVFCHECGAQGEEIEGYACDDSHVEQLEAAARSVWSDRNERHYDLYVSSQENKSCC